MTKRFHGLVFGLATLLAAGAAQAAIHHLTADMDGFQEISPTGQPGAGDADGSGFADLFIDDSNATITWDIDADNIVFPLVGAHIHEAPAGQNGPIVVDFNAQLSGSGVSDPDLLRVIQNPADFYVNLHNALFPAGAIRGQLGAAPVPEPGALTMLAAALGLFGWARRRA